MSNSVKSAMKFCVASTDVLAAYELIKPHIRCTPLLRCSTFDRLSGKTIFLKAENLQTTGSFKYRGAINSVVQVSLSEKNNVKCVATHSSGNHGQAVAKAAQVFGIPAYIVMPTTAPDCKKNAVKAYGGIVIECEPTEQGRVDKANEVCQAYSATMIHASQTKTVIAGQGTMAIEMLQQNPDLEAIVAPVGGSGMISGIAIAAKHIKPSIKIYAAEPEEANDCYLSKLNGYRTPLTHTPKTIADGVKVSIGENTWPIIDQFVDDVITVTEDEIKNAVKLIWERAKLVAEPTSGVGVAAVIGENFKNAKGAADVEKIGVVVCGGNIDFSMASALLC